jgi:hypothetical protein
MNTTLRLSNGQPLRRECWEATTVDGEWGFERIEDTGTPWEIVYLPGTEQHETIPHYFGTLKAARMAVERGWAAANIPSVLRAAHDAGDHTYERYGCPTCDANRQARMRAEHDARWGQRS